MAEFGDVLRGLGSVLNPAVMQDVNAERARQQAAQQQIGGVLLQDALQQEREKRALAVQKESPEYQAKLEALKNEQAFRTGASALDPNAPDYASQMAKLATKHGKPEVAATMFKAQEDRAARLQQSKDINELKKLTLEQNHELTMQRLTGEAERRAETERHNKAMEALQGQNAEMNGMFKTMMLDLQKQKLDRLSDEKTKKDVQQLSKVIETAKLNDQNAVLSAAENAVKNPAVLSAATGLGSMRPDFTLPTEVALGKQAISKLFNIELKNRSGAAVTIPEFERLKDEYGQGLFKKPEQLAGAIKQARALLTKHYQSVAAGFDPSTLKAYNENLAGLGGMPVIEPIAKPGADPTDPLGIRRPK